MNFNIKLGFQNETSMRIVLFTEKKWNLQPGFQTKTEGRRRHFGRTLTVSPLIMLASNQTKYLLIDGSVRYEWPLKGLLSYQSDTQWPSDPMCWIKGILHYWGLFQWYSNLEMNSIHATVTVFATHARMVIFFTHLARPIYIISL